MASNQAAVIAIGLGCMVAAAGGGYLAMRQNTVPMPASANAPASAPAPGSTPALAPVATPATPLSRPVQDTTESPASVPAPRAQTAVSKPTPPAKAPVARHDDTRASAVSTRRSIAPLSAQNAAPQFDRTPAPATPPQSQSQLGAPLPAPPPLPTPATTDATITTAPRQDDRAVQEAPRAPEPPQKTLQELVVQANSVIGLQTETRVSSETARVEDRVEARVTRDVKVGDMVAIPAGSRVIGSIIQADRGGKFKEKASLDIRFHTLVLPDGTRLPMSTAPIHREGESPSDGSAAKIGGGAVGGAILGAILGGAKGAAIGATAGAGGGAAVAASGDPKSATLPAGTPMTVRILAPISITVER
jgi:type IV secretory pathway VirB10-like protein